MSKAPDGSGYDPAKRAKGDRIICPGLAAMYMNGDLEINEETGQVSKE